MKKKLKIFGLCLLVLVGGIYGCNHFQKKNFINRFIANINNPNFKNGNGQYLDSIMIEDQLIYYTSSDSCGNDTDGFDLCVLYFPDGSIFTNSSVHFCGAEGTSSYLRNLYKDKIVEFKSSLIEAGFKN